MQRSRLKSHPCAVLSHVASKEEGREGRGEICKALWSIPNSNDNSNASYYALTRTATMGAPCIVLATCSVTYINRGRQAVCRSLDGTWFANARQQLFWTVFFVGCFFMLKRAKERREKWLLFTPLLAKPRTEDTGTKCTSHWCTHLRHLRATPLSTCSE